MPEMTVAFKDLPALNLVIDNTDLGRNYYELVKKNYKKQKPVFRDSAKCTIDYMHQLADQAQKELGWEWHADQYNLDVTTHLHTNLVELLGTSGFEHVPEHLDSMLHDMHFCLHALEHGTNTRTSWLQIEWFNTDGFELPTDFEFQTQVEFGDLKLQNPYVGHPPQQVFAEGDFDNIDSTCKFHDRVIPGVMIYIQHSPTIIDRDKVLSAFQKHTPEFVNRVGADTIKYYTGAPVIGHVKNLDDLCIVQEAPLLELDYIWFKT